MSGTVTIGKVRLADEFLSHQIDSIEAEQAVMSARVTTVEDEVAVVKSNAEASSTTAVSDRVTTVEQDVTAAGQDISAVSTRVTAVEQDIGALEQADSAVSTRVTAVEQDIGALESQDITLASATTAVSNRVTATEQDIAAAESDISALETDWNSFKSVAYVSGGTSLTIDRTDGVAKSTVLSTNSANYIRGSTYFRIENETLSRAYIDTNGFTTRATDSTSYQVGNTLQDLLARVADIEQYFLDTRRTVKLYSHVAGKYMDHGGNLGTTSSSVNAHYSIEFD